jgi:hypothetical protein
MSISLSCECGKKLAVKDELAGKKVKCPGCASVLTVPAANSEEATPAALPPLEEDEAPLPPRKKSTKMNGGGKKKSNKMLWIGAAAGVLVLGFCCVGIAGGAAWWFLLRGGPEKPILGKWGMDVEATKKNNKQFADMLKMMPEMEKEMGSGFMEFKSDGTMTMSFGNKNETGKWKNAEAKGDTVTIDTQPPNKTEWEKIEFKVIDSTHLQATPLGKSKKEGTLWLKRL